MPAKTASIVSVVLTVLLLLVLAVLILFFELVALNGASESQGMTAMGISLLCQGVGALLPAWLAWKSTSLLIKKHSFHPILAVVITVVLAVVVGGVLAFLSLVISIPVAGIR